MAHADYDCCAVCDSKMSYSGGDSAGTKEDLCFDCARRLKDLGVDINDANDLLGWIEDTPISEIAPVLVDAGFRRCYYENFIDTLLVGSGAQFDNDRMLMEYKKP